MKGLSGKNLRRMACVGCAGLFLVSSTTMANDVEPSKGSHEELKRLILPARPRGVGLQQAAAEPVIEATPKVEPPAKEELYIVGQNLDFRAHWLDGLWFETCDQAYLFHIRGRFDVNAFWTDAEFDGFELGSAALIRRGVLGVEGRIHEVFEYVVELDFAGNANKWQDVWVGVNDLPHVGTIRAGHLKEPFSLEQLTLSSYTTFIERSIIDSAFVPAYNLGVEARDTYCCEHGTWALGLFRNTDLYGVALDSGSLLVHGFNEDVADDEYSATGRITYLPWYEHEGRCLLHVGGAVSFRELNDTQVRHLGTRPYDNDLVTDFDGNDSLDIIRTDNIAGVDRAQLVGAEAALVLGALSAQGEFIVANLDRPAAGDLHYHGWYGYVSYFLTGENRNYNRHYGAFDRIRPIENFWLVRSGDGCEPACCCGKGAWELAARYAYLDLADGAVAGGNLSQWTFGVNWHWNPNMKVMLNYELFNVNQDAIAAFPIPGTEDTVDPIPARDGTLQAWTVRLHIDF